MKYILNFIFFVLFSIKSINAQIPQFVNILKSNQHLSAFSALEYNNHYYFNVFRGNINSQNRNSTTIVYKTNLNGNIEDSILLYENNNIDTCYAFVNTVVLNQNLLGLYGNRFTINSINGNVTDEYYLSHFLDTNLNIVYTNTQLYGDTSKIYSFLNTIKIKNKIYHLIIIKNALGLPDNKVHILDTLGNFIKHTHYPDNNYASSTNYIIQHPNNKDLISSVLHHGFWQLVYTDSDYNFIRTDSVNVGWLAPDNVGIMPFNNSEMLMYSTMYSITNSPDSICAYRVDTNNNLIKKTCIAPPNHASQFTSANLGLKTCDKVNNNNIYLGGVYNGDPYILYSSIFTISNLDSNLNVRWTKSFEDSYSYLFYNYTATSDGGCILIGLYNSDTSRSSLNKHIEPVILKIDSTGTITSLINFSNNLNHQVLAYPNPSTTTISFVVSNQLDNATATIFSSNGQYVKSFIVHHGENVQNISTLPIGNYFYEIVNKKGEKANGKFSKK